MAVTQETNSTHLNLEAQLSEVKKNAADFFKQGKFEEAILCYSEALEIAHEDPVLLNNRSLALHRLGRYSQALSDAEASTRALTQNMDAEVDDTWIQTLSKSFYRQGAALLSLDRPSDALKAFQNGLKVEPGEGGLVKGVRSCVSALFPLTALACLLAQHIREGEAPGALSPRDGKILKPVFPEDVRLGEVELEKVLREILAGREDEARGIIARQIIKGVSGGAGGESDLSFPRFALAAYRAWAYLQRDNPSQALKDAKLAVAWSTNTTSSPTGWPRACYLVGLSLEACCSTLGLQTTELAKLGEGNRNFALHCATSTAAAISMRRAFESSPETAEFTDELKRLLRKVPDEQRKVLLVEGADALVAFLEEEKWRNAPEYMRPRPKYYYYYEWMKERIYEHYPSLPGPVMDKLLAIDAAELDLLLQYPKAIRGQVEEYLEVFREKGGKYLETYRTPSLSWEEVKAMKGAGTVGLGTGFHAPGEGHLLEGTEKNTNHALVGGGGDGGLTEAERRGVPAPTTLPPDHLRDHQQIKQAEEKQYQRLIESGGTVTAAPGRQASIMAAAESAVLEAAETKRRLTVGESHGTGDLDGVD